MNVKLLTELWLMGCGFTVEEIDAIFSNKRIVHAMNDEDRVDTWRALSEAVNWSKVPYDSEARKEFSKLYNDRKEQLMFITAVL